MTMANSLQEDENAKLTLKQRLKNFKPPSKKKMFWAWITYQAVKGTLTTTFIWVPAIIYWFHH